MPALFAVFPLALSPAWAADRPSATAVVPPWIERLKGADPAARRAIGLLLEENARPVVQGPELALSTIERETESLETAWRSLRDTLEERRSRLGKVTEEARAASRAASLLSAQTPWFWLSGLLGVGTLAGVVIHDRRHELRRWLGGRGGRGLMPWAIAAGLVLAGLAIAAILLQDRVGQDLGRTVDGQSPPQTGIATASSSTPLSPGEMRRSYEALKRGQETVLAASYQPIAEALGPASRLAAQGRALRIDAMELGGRVALVERLASAVEADLAALEEVNRELATQEEAAAGYVRIRQGVRAGLGVGLLGFVATGGWLLRRGAARRREGALNTCPLCLGPIGSASQSSNGRPPTEIVRCRNLLSREPSVACNYAFRAAYRGMTKLSLPTLGVPKAGKTHWLAMLHWQLSKGVYPRSIRFERLKRLQAESGEDYDRIIEQVLHSRLGTAATQRDRIPYPAVFQFRDRDRWGRSSVLVNIFDYSGEATSDMGAEDYRRRRALRGDGFFFFLDPTFPAEPQAKAMAEFHEDLRLVRGIAGPRDLGVPVAVCVSKIDLLARRPREAGWQPAPRGGDDVAAGFYERLHEIDPSGESLAEGVLRARSELVVRVRDAIWPGWEVERTLDGLFAGRWLFFPLTPVGLDGRGETDLNLRTIAPFGLVEPLAWLLHKSGYPVLE